MIKGIIFDMDGLIFDSERVVQRAWAEIGEEYGYPGMGDQIYHTVGFNRQRREIYFKSVYGQDFPHDRFVDKTREIFSRIVDTEGLPMKAGAEEVLKLAKEKRLRVGLATSSSSDYAIHELTTAGIYEYFDGFVFGNMVTKSKPDPEIYLKACEAVGIKAEEGLALEDAPSGVESASRAGLRVIMVPDLVQPEPEIRAKAWKVVDSLEEVIPLLERQ
ncbi:Phosphorylated carbohydrates phosphatase TM_1254 [uncultured Eubacterium sp.]|nr:Phosphorylated carbohydrates phosphatase TM_1254 [uncultured Eubacterium sp.]